ncbi:hypothetical protein ACIBO2_23605 [Nonomuraea sp. NPDC050022]
MRALQYIEIGRPSELTRVPRPAAGPGQVVPRVPAAGVRGAAR